MRRTTAAPEAIVAPPSCGRFLAEWLSLGAQSFGGGMATLALIKQVTVDRRGWITPEEFTRFWALVQAAPGINLLAFTMLIGRKVLGMRGLLIALVGLLAPSVAITILITAFYARFRQMPAVQHALHGMVPVTVGLGLITAFQIIRPSFRASQREGRVSGALGLLVIPASAAMTLLLHVPVIYALLGGGLLMAASACGAARQNDASAKAGSA